MLFVWFIFAILLCKIDCRGIAISFVFVSFLFIAINSRINCKKHKNVFFLPQGIIANGACLRTLIDLSTILVFNNSPPTYLHNVELLFMNKIVQRLPNSIIEKLIGEILGASLCYQQCSSIEVIGFEPLLPALYAIFWQSRSAVSEI